MPRQQPGQPRRGRGKSGATATDLSVTDSPIGTPVAWGIESRSDAGRRARPRGGADRLERDGARERVADSLAVCPPNCFPPK